MSSLLLPIAHTLARWLLGSALVGYLGIHGVAKQEPARGVDLVLFIAMAVALVVLVVTAEPLRQRRYTLHAGRRAGTPAVWVEPPRKSQGGKRGLRRRALATSTAILELLGEYKRNDPTRDPWWYPHPNWDSMSDEDKTRIFNEHGSKSSAHRGELMTRYQAEHSVEALWLYGEFARRGMTAGVERHVFEHPVNTFCLEEIAQHLGVWAKGL